MDNKPTRRDRLGQTTDCSSVKRFCNNSSSAHVGMHVARDRKTLCPPEPKIHWTTKGGSIESCCGLISEDLIIIITTDDSELLVRGQWQRGRTEIATMNHLFTTTESVEECSASARVQSTALVGFCCYWLANDQFSGLVLCCCMKKFNNAICKIKCIQSSDVGDRQRYITLNGQQLGIGGYVNMFPN